MASKKNGKYSKEELTKIITSIDTELNATGSYGSDELSNLRRDYMQKYFRADEGNEEEGYSTYHSPMIQDHVLQTRAYLLRPFNKSRKPVVDFSDENSTNYINHLFRYELDGKRLLQDSAWNGALLKTMAAKVWVKSEMITEEDYAVFTGDSKEEIEEEIDLFFSEDEGLEQVGEIIWEENEVAPETDEVPAEQVAPEAPVNPEAPTGPIPTEALGVVAELGAPVQEQAPVEAPQPEVTIEYKAVVRVKKERIERRPKIDIIPPYEFYISNQAPSQEEANIVGRVSPMTLSDLRTAFPDAPKMNGFKGKAQEKKFWTDITGEEGSWNKNNEWYALWVKDNSSFYNSSYFSGAVDIGSPDYAYLVADVDMNLDLYDTGISSLHNVIKVGNFVLSCEAISQPSFSVGSLIPVGGRWLGQSVADLIWDENTSVTNNMRAADNGVLQSTYANPVVDEEQIELDDVINRVPDSVIRRKQNAVPKQGVPALEWTQTPGPNPSTFQLVEKYQEFAGTSTGAGKFFQGHNRDNISSARVGQDTANIIENNSDLMLDDMSSNFWDWWANLLRMLHNAAVIGKATEASFMVGKKYTTVNPAEDLMIIKKGFMDLVVGSEEEQYDMDDAKEAFAVLKELEAMPTLANLVTPEGKMAIVANLFKKAGADDEELQLMFNPDIANDVMQSPEVQQKIQEITQQAEQQTKAAIEEFKNSAEMQIKQGTFEFQKAESEARNAQMDFKQEEVAAKIASEYEMRGQSQEKIDIDKEHKAAQIGLSEEKLENEELNDDREYELAKEGKDVNLD